MNCTQLLNCLVPTALLLFAAGMGSVEAREPDRIVDLWPDLAPGETTRDVGHPRPQRANEIPPATRVEAITRPQLWWYDPPAGQRSGAAVLVFPGGGYNYVVVDKEGSEVAEWLNSLGIAAGVVRYRSKAASWEEAAFWSRPVQDGQRAVRLVRTHAKQWGLDANRIGVLGFSAGGNAAALVSTRFDHPEYQAIDDIDAASPRPDACLLLYPWRLVNSTADGLAEEVTVSPQTPASFLVHAHDDGVTSLSSVYFYTALKRLNLPAELHIYANGGHGYGLRPVEDSDVDTWPDRAATWLEQVGWTVPQDVEDTAN
ncbi:MAG: alpha/beta hydrolase [Planctomycetaceae bacterium]